MRGAGVQVSAGQANILLLLTVQSGCTMVETYALRPCVGVVFMIRLEPFCDRYTEALLPFIADFWDVHHAEFSSETCCGILRDWTKGDGRFFVIVRDETAVGFLRTHNSSPTVCWIDDIYVDALQRGQGIASAAIRQLEKSLLADGCRSFCMEVAPDNLPAMRLYHRLGYDRLSLITMRKDYEDFETERVEHIAGLPMRIRHLG